MLTKQSLTPAFLLIALMVCGCSHNDVARERVITDSAGHITAVYLTSREIEQAGIKFGNMIKQENEKLISCYGNLIVAPANKIIIPAPAAGKITSISCQAGYYVKAGFVLAVLQNSDFITLQQEFLEIKNQLDYLREEYTRQGELTVENATSLKKMQIARRDYQSAELKLHALQLQLDLLGISTDSLKYDNMSPVIPIKTSESGNIAGIKVHPGKYVEKGETLFELVKTKHLLAELKVPESYFQFLRPGMAVIVFLANDSLTAHKAKLSSVIREINPNNQQATIYAELFESTGQYIPGISVNAMISLGKDTLRLLNSNSIVHNTSGDYLFIMDEGLFRRIPVKLGKKAGAMNEIIEFSAETTDSLVTEGVEYLNTLYDLY